MTILERILNNWPYKLIALILAIGLRVYVANQNAAGDKAAEKTVITVPVKVEGIPYGFQELSGTQSVRLTLTGGASAENIRPSDCSAIVDASKAHDGDNSSLPISVALPPDLQSSVQVLSIMPATAAITLQQIGVITRAARVNISAHPPAGFVFGLPGVSPPSVNLYGPVSSLERVSDVMVDYSQNEPMNAPVTSATLGVLPKDAKGLIVPGISITPKTLQVTIPLLKISSSSSISISPVHTGQPAPGSNVLGVVSTPQSVLVSGDAKALAAVKTILTAPVDITGSTSDVTKKVKLIAPSSLTLVSDQSATVTVKIGKQANSPIPAH